MIRDLPSSVRPLILTMFSETRIPEVSWRVPHVQQGSRYCHLHLLPLRGFISRMLPGKLRSWESNTVTEGWAQELWQGVRVAILSSIVTCHRMAEIVTLWSHFPLSKSIHFRCSVHDFSLLAFSLHTFFSNPIPRPLVSFSFHFLFFSFFYIKRGDSSCLL